MKKEFVKADIEVLEIKWTAKSGAVDTQYGEECPICHKVWTGVSGDSAHKGWCPDNTTNKNS